jgi:hypothetical protein
MTAIFCRLPPDRDGRVVSHRLLTIGETTHVTGCLDRIDATLRLVLTPTRPPRRELCPGCARDLDAKLQRVPAVDLGVSVREVGALADVIVGRTRTTRDLKGPASGAEIVAAAQRALSLDDQRRLVEWCEGGVPEMVMAETTSKAVMR